MSRITVEDCLRKVQNRFELVLLASQRARQLFKGAKPLIESDNREVVVALREIADGKIRKAENSFDVVLSPFTQGAYLSFYSPLLPAMLNQKSAALPR